MPAPDAETMTPDTPERNPPSAEQPPVEAAPPAEAPVVYVPASADVVAAVMERDVLIWCLRRLLALRGIGHFDGADIDASACGDDVRELVAQAKRA
jgi:hypothetical protein